MIVDDILTKVKAYDNAMSSWTKDAQISEDVYKSKINATRDDLTNVNPEYVAAASVFNILAHNTSILQAHTFTKLPKARITARIPGNLQANTAAQVLEKVLDTTMAQDKDTYENVEKAVLDMLVVGRGVIWTAYDADEKEICNEYVYWKDFGHTSWAKTWDNVSEVWRKIELSAEDMQEYFGLELGEDKQDSYNVIEFFDKVTDSVYFVCEDFDEILLTAPNPTGVPEMMPCVAPLFAGTQPNSLLPIIPFSMYAQQAIDVAELTQRIGDLGSQLKVSGAFASQFGTVIPEIFSAPNGTLVPVEMGDTMTLGSNHSVKDMLLLNPIDVWAGALSAAIQARNELLQTISIISGVNELQSGYSTNPYENSKVTQAKIQGISTRVKPKQIAVQRFMDRMYKLSGRMLAELMPIKDMIELSGIDIATEKEQQAIIKAAAVGKVPLPPKLIAKVNNPSQETLNRILKDEKGLMLAISIDNASLVVVDREEEKQMRMASLSAMTAVLQGAAGLIQQQPEFAPLICKSLKFITGSSAYGDELAADLDSTINKLVEDLGKQSAQGNQQNQITGQMLLENLRHENTVKEITLKAQLDAAAHQFEGQLKLQIAQLDAQTKQETQRISADANIKATKIAHAQVPAPEEGLAATPFGGVSEDMLNMNPDI